MEAFDSTGIFTSTMMERTSQWQSTRRYYITTGTIKIFRFACAEKLGISKQKLSSFFDIHGPIDCSTHINNYAIFTWE